MEAATLEQRAYLAGLFDGEGTVAVYESAARTGRPIWIYQVQIANCCLKVLDAVAEMVGGSVVKKSRGKSNWRQGFVWRTCGESAAHFMRIVRPYSIVKASEIDEALRFRELCRRPRGERQSEEQIAEKRAVVSHLKVLKRAI